MKSFVEDLPYLVVHDKGHPAAWVGTVIDRVALEQIFVIFVSYQRQVQ